MKTEQIAELKALLHTIEAANENFHTMKGLRAWASEENHDMKRLIRKSIEEALKIVND